MVVSSANEQLLNLCLSAVWLRVMIRCFALSVGPMSAFGVVVELAPCSILRPSALEDMAGKDLFVSFRFVESES